MPKASNNFVKNYNDTSVITDLAQRVLHSEEFEEAVKEANIPVADLIHQLPKKEDILKIAEGELYAQQSLALNYTESRKVQRLSFVLNFFTITLFSALIVFFSVRIFFWHNLPLNILWALALGLFSIVTIVIALISRKNNWDFAFLWQVATAPSINRNVRRAREQILNLQSRIDKAIMEGSIKEALRSYINRLKAPSYSLDLNLPTAVGFSEVQNPSFTIDTNASEELDFMLNHMAGGSIGISGPRGAGKSTLMQSVCQSGDSDIIKNKRTIAMTTSAPVEYLSRDFLLHLFSTACHAVLTLEGITAEEAEQQLRSEEAITFELRKIRKIHPSTIFTLFAIGYLFVIAAAWGGLHTDKQKPPTINLAVYSVPDTSYPPILLNPAQNSKGNRPDPSKDTDLIARPFYNLLEISGISSYPILFFWLGMFCMVTAGYFYYKRRAFFRKKASKAKDGQRFSATVVRDTIYWLREIKFQRSFTSGWSGALKLPIGLEGNANRSMSYNYRPLSNPELVAGFREYLQQLAANYTIIIGIDELDKIESDESAQKFLNEIKAVFGLSGVFFLISVSENAMSQFERRGLPLRDVFDSSFDAIIRVDYLTFSMAEQLLQRRIIGQPIPFIALVYCLSGGLPRDLIRIFRQVVKLHNKGTKRLPDVAAALIKDDIFVKIRAVRIFLKKMGQEPVTEGLLNIIYELEIGGITEALLVAGIQKIRLLDYNKPSPEADKEAVRAAQKTGYEVLGYLYMMTTTLQFFNDKTTEDSLKNVVTKITDAEPSDIEKLAKSRQFLSVDPEVSLMYINLFREGKSLPAIV